MIVRANTLVKVNVLWKDASKLASLTKLKNMNSTLVGSPSAPRAASYATNNVLSKIIFIQFILVGFWRKINFFRRGK
jgi:hypothetical protein